MDTAQWPQPREENPKASGSGGKISTKTTKKEEEEEEAVKKCPRCNSTKTKFCYYNNYSLTQPRYFCKTCRRYWTQGGSLRNIPVGGGSRKNKRSSSSYSKSVLPNLVSHDPNSSLQNPNHDLNLGFPSSNPPTSFLDLIQLDSSKNFQVPSSVSASAVAVAGNCSLPVSALELLTGVSVGPRGFDSSGFGSIYNSAGFDGLSELKPMSLGFSVDGINGNRNHEENATNGRLLFPFEDLKQVSANDNNGENGIAEKSDSIGYWSGMLGGNGSW